MAIAFADESTEIPALHSVHVPVTVRPWMLELDPATVKDSPCFVIDLGALENNLRVLDDVERRSEANILLAFKGFAAHSTFDLVKKYLAGAAVSSPNEARLAHEFGFPEVHAYAPGYKASDLEQIVKHAGHVNFNSFSQWEQLGHIPRKHGVECGVRVNPEHSEVEQPLYNPCAPASRMGVTRENFRPDLLKGLTGLHMHTLCELGAEPFARTLPVFEHKFGEFLRDMKWMNFGGGHHITRDDYDRDLLVRLIRDFRAKYKVEVYLEPGEAIAIGTGCMVTTVLDVIKNRMNIAVLDCSATAHMSDVMEFPYRPLVHGAGSPGEKPYTYRLGGCTCLTGDLFGDYSFDKPLKAGDKLVIYDMAHYTMVKTTNFNGVQLPSIALRENGNVRVVKQFGYESYRDRLS